MPRILYLEDNQTRCECMVSLVKNALVEVFMRRASERYSGRARVVRIEWRDTSWERYGFQFIEKSSRLIL